MEVRKIILLSIVILALFGAVQFWYLFYYKPSTAIDNTPQNIVKEDTFIKPPVQLVPLPKRDTENDDTPKETINVVKKTPVNIWGDDMIETESLPLGISKPETVSESKWAQGLLGRSVDNSKASCQIPFGKIEFNTTVPKWPKCETKTFARLSGVNDNMLTIDWKCSSWTKRNCLEQAASTMLPLDPHHFSDPCPIYYFLKNKYGENPNPEGNYYTGVVEVPDDEQFIVVSCAGVTNALIRVSRKGNGKKPPEDYEDLPKNVDGKPNIVILLLDGLSRVHFHRMMPATRSTLESIHNGDTGYKLLEFFRYHSNDYSSNSNMTPFMTGINWFQYCHHKFKCKFTPKVPYHRFLFHYLFKKGYKTGFPMEQCWIKYQADWYYEHRGWTNYFGFPLAEDLTECMDDNLPPCVHGKHAYKYLLEWTQKFYNLHTRSPKFVFNLFLESHERSMKVVDVMDKDLAVYLKDLANKRDNTFIFVMSDHGIHYGPFFDKEWTGYLEHKLPLLTVLVPDQFQKQYPTQFTNMARNTQKLVTHYDMYQTLKDMGTLSPELFNRPEWKGGKDGDGYEIFGRSLFDPIPYQRECEESGLPFYVCSCNKRLTQIPAGWRECGKGPMQQDCD